MDDSIRPIQPAGVSPIAPRRRRAGEQPAPFDLGGDEPAPSPSRETAPPAEAARAERSVAPRGDDDPGARIDLSA